MDESRLSVFESSRVEYIDWFSLTRDRIRFWTFVNTVMNF